MALDEPGQGGGAPSSERKPPDVEPRRERLPDGLEEEWRARSAGVDSESLRRAYASEMASRYRAALAGVRATPHSQASTPDLHISGVPTIYLIEREAIRLRRLRVQQFKSAAVENMGRVRVDLSRVETTVSRDLAQYTRPKHDSHEKPIVRKSFLERLRRLLSLWQ
jgi:hypothetical protein